MSGRPAIYEDRTSFCLSLPKRLLDRAKLQATIEGKRCNELINGALTIYLKDKGLPDDLKLPEGIEQKQGMFHCTKCNQVLAEKADVVSHKCLNLFESIPAEEPQVVD